MTAGIFNPTALFVFSSTREDEPVYTIGEDEHTVRLLHYALSSGEELQRAARSGDMATVKECLAEGANVNGRDQSGWTALHRAAFKGRMECVQVLVSHGAEVDAVDGSGFSVRLLRSLCFVFCIPSSPKSLFRLLHSEDKQCCLDEYSSSISSQNQK